MSRTARSLGMYMICLAACGDPGGGSGGFASAGAGSAGTTATPTGGQGSSSDGSGGDTQGESGGSGEPGTTTTTGSTSTGGAETSSGGPGSSGADDSTGGDLCKPGIDLVFVMDVSTSMYDVLSTLADEILVVDQAIAALPVDVDVRYGLVVFVDDVTAVDDGAPYTDVTQLQADFIEWSTFTQSNSQTDGQGSNEDFPENTLDALYAAATVFPWRPTGETLRMVIHTTDDTFGDKGAIQSGEVVQHGYDETVLALQEREIRVFAFADDDMTGGPADMDDVSMGFFTPYAGKTPIPAATDGGAFNLNDVYKQKISLSAAINQSVVDSLCAVYIPM